MMDSVSAAMPSLTEDKFNVDRFFCVFCYKEINHISSPETGGESLNVLNTPERFFKFVSRHLGVNRKIGSNSLKPNDVKYCLDCLAIIVRYGELYHEIKCLELSLNWQIDKLGNVMKFADRVPSRYKTFRKWCDGYGSEDVPKRVDLVDFRRDFKKKCKMYKTKTFPRILLNRCENKSDDQRDVTPSTSTENSQMDAQTHLATEEATSSAHKKSEYFLGWITSMSALIFLFHLNAIKVQRRHVNSQTLPMSPERVPGAVVYRPEDEYNHDFVVGEVEPDTASMRSYSEESSHSEGENELGYEPITTSGIGLEPKQETHRDSVIQENATEQHFPADPLTPALSQSIMAGLNQTPTSSYPTGMENMIVDEDPSTSKQEGMSKYEVPVAVLGTADLDLQSVSGVGPGSILSNYPIECSLPGSSFTSHGSLPISFLIPLNNTVKTTTSLDTQNETESHSNKLTKDENIVCLATPPVPPKSELPVEICKRSLRQVFRCPVCKATFSSPTRLEQHSSTCHADSDSMDISDDDQEENWDASGIATEDTTEWKDNDEDLSNENKHAAGGQRNTSDLKAESNDDAFTSGTESEPEYGKKPTPLATTRRKRFPKGPTICTKCSPCQWFPSRKKLENHDEYFHSSGQVFISYIPKNLTIHHLKLENFPSDTKQHPCPIADCGEAFTHPDALENHSKIYHNPNTFTCTFCDLAIDSVLDLIDHELEHSDAKELLEDKDFRKGEQFVCGRCHDRKGLKIDFINHFLQEHLELPPIQATCPICRQVFANVLQVPLTHYMSFHDLRRLENPSKPFRCSSQQDTKECPAYFLTEDQLHVHRNKFHGTEGALVEDKVAVAEKARQEKAYKDKVKLQPRTLACPLCPQKFKFPAELRAHTWRQHGKGKELKNKSARFRNKMLVSCPEDGITIDDIVYDKKGKYFCCVENCNRGFMEESDLVKHSKLHGEFKCSYCETVKTFAPDLSIHETVHSVEVEGKHSKKIGGYSFRCPRCSFVTNIKLPYIQHHLEKHMALEMDKKRCPICQHAYSWNMLSTRIPNFREMIQEHYTNFHDISDTNGEGDEVKGHKCERDECKAYFRTALQLQQHVLEMHDKVSREDLWKCPDCGKHLEGVKRFKEHRIRAHGMCVDDFQFVCRIPECVERFEREVDLEYHMRFVHAPCNKLLECPRENCTRKFWGQSCLTNHLKGSEHRGDRPLNVCEECGKSFKQKVQLETHMQFHAGPETWKYSCSVCNKKIISQQKLNEHMRTHTKEKPFVCQVCGAAYAHRHNLRIHVNSKHGLQDAAKKYDIINKGSSRKGKTYK